MGKTKKSTLRPKFRLDKYYNLIGVIDYRSRASYKLLKLDDKYSIFSSSRSVLDLCSAPGGWLQVAMERAPVGSLVVGVDIVRVDPLRDVICVQADITSATCCSKVEKVLVEKGVSLTFDVVLHDGPGPFDRDNSENCLVIDAVKLATQFLAPQGHFVTKVLVSQDYSSIVYCLEKLFDKVEVFKPVGSRLEKYVIGLRYKALGKIDPDTVDKYFSDGAAEAPSVSKISRLFTKSIAITMF